MQCYLTLYMFDIIMLVRSLVIACIQLRDKINLSKSFTRLLTHFIIFTYLVLSFD